MTAVLRTSRKRSRARDCIDAYLRIDPGNGDAYLIRGLYDYFIDIAPPFAHFLRFLLFLPAGNRTEGLKEIERAAAQGTLFATEAQRELIDIYGALEGRPADAIARAEDLERRYPASDDVQFALAEFYESPAIEDHGRAAATYEVIVARRQGDSTLDEASARYRAILGLAGARFDAWRCEDALELLTRVIDAHPPRPVWVLPRYLLRRANYRALMNDPRAGDDARRVQTDPQMKTWQKDAGRMVDLVARQQLSGESPLYAALIPANRLVAEGRWDDAKRGYESIGKGRLGDPQLQYRLAYLDFARGSFDAARPVFAALAARSRAPDWIRAAAWLNLGRLDDLAGRRADATKAYEKVVDSYPQERVADAAKVGLITAYHRPAR
jgi:tetratricopeptide (TPR) repeat protein